MDGLKLKEQVELIRQVFGYVTNFNGKIFVINIDSKIMLDPLFPVLVKDLVLLKKIGIKIVLVPGASKRIDEILTQYGIPWEHVDGIRITAPEAMPFVKMAAFDVSNMLMTLLAENKTDAVIGNWVRARGIGIRQGVDFRSAGRVDKLKLDIIRNVLDQGLVPIFPNIGWNVGGRPYNISSVELATTISRHLLAEKLFFVTGPEYISSGSYRLPDGVDVKEDGKASRLTLAEAGKFLESNVGQGSRCLLELVSRACSACQAGVKRVHIIDGGVEGVILKEIFSNRGIGTMIYTDEHSNIRPMIHSDIPEVLRIMQPLVEKEILIPRTDKTLEAQCADFVVYEVDGIVHASGALHQFGGGKGEIAGLAVDETYSNLGIGQKIVSYLVEQAKEQNLEQIFALTTQTFDWFLQLGFRRGTKAQLPTDKLDKFDSKRNSVILFYDL